MEGDSGPIYLEVGQILHEQLGCVVAPANERLVIEDLGATSLDMASLQLAFEEKFGVKFNDGSGTPRTAIDDEWDACKTVGDFVELAKKYNKRQES